jgi:hypothetical protein
VDHRIILKWILRQHRHAPTYAKVASWWSGASRILRQSKFSTHMVNYICIERDVQLKSKLHHTGTWSASARQPHLLWYRPAIFFCYFRLIALSFPQGKFRCSLQKCYYSYFNFILFKNCVKLKLRNLKYLKSGSVCSLWNVNWIHVA